MSYKGRALLIHLMSFPRRNMEWFEQGSSIVMMQCMGGLGKRKWDRLLHYSKEAINSVTAYS